MKRLTLQHVRQEFEKEGYLLLSDEYVSCCIKLYYECPEGHKHKIDYEHFKQGHRCPDCALVKRVAKRRKLFSDICSCLESEGYCMLSLPIDYRNNNSMLKYGCPAYHVNFMSWNNFQQGYRCPDCYGNKVLTMQYVESIFEKESYTILSKKYKNAFSNLFYRCPKGHRNRTSWNNFQQGYRCPECREWKNQRRLGEILKQIFPNQVKSQDNLDFLGRQRVDYSVRDLKLAFEYDGAQHYMPVKWFGGEEKFRYRQSCDDRKTRLCKKNGYDLVRIAYNEELNKQVIQLKIDKILMQRQRN